MKRCSVVAPIAAAPCPLLLISLLSLLLPVLLCCTSTTAQQPLQQTEISLLHVGPTDPTSTTTSFQIAPFNFVVTDSSDVFHVDIALAGHSATTGEVTVTPIFLEWTSTVTGAAAAASSSCHADFATISPRSYTWPAASNFTFLDRFHISDFRRPGENCTLYFAVNQTGTTVLTSNIVAPAQTITFATPALVSVELDDAAALTWAVVVENTTGELAATNNTKQQSRVLLLQQQNRNYTGRVHFAPFRTSMANDTIFAASISATWLGELGAVKVTPAVFNFSVKGAAAKQGMSIPFTLSAPSSRGAVEAGHRLMWTISSDTSRNYSNNNNNRSNNNLTRFAPDSRSFLTAQDLLLAVDTAVPLSIYGLPDEIAFIKNNSNGNNTMAPPMYEMTVFLSERLADNDTLLTGAITPVSPRTQVAPPASGQPCVKFSPPQIVFNNKSTRGQRQFVFRVTPLAQCGQPFSNYSNTNNSSDESNATAVITFNSTSFVSTRHGATTTPLGGYRVTPRGFYSVALSPYNGTCNSSSNNSNSSNNNSNNVITVAWYSLAYVNRPIDIRIFSACDVVITVDSQQHAGSATATTATAAAAVFPKRLQFALGSGESTVIQIYSSNLNASADVDAAVVFLITAEKQLAMNNSGGAGSGLSSSLLFSRNYSCTFLPLAELDDWREGLHRLSSGINAREVLLFPGYENKQMLLLAQRAPLFLLPDRPVSAAMLTPRSFNYSSSSSSASSSSARLQEQNNFLSFESPAITLQPQEYRVYNRKKREQQQHQQSVGFNNIDPAVLAQCPAKCHCWANALALRSEYGGCHFGWSGRYCETCDPHIVVGCDGSPSSLSCPSSNGDPCAEHPDLCERISSIPLVRLYVIGDQGAKNVGSMPASLLSQTMFLLFRPLSTAAGGLSNDFLALGSGCNSSLSVAVVTLSGGNNSNNNRICLLDPLDSVQIQLFALLPLVVDPQQLPRAIYVGQTISVSFTAPHSGGVTVVAVELAGGGGRRRGSGSSSGNVLVQPGELSWSSQSYNVPQVITVTGLRPTLDDDGGPLLLRLRPLQLPSSVVVVPSALLSGRIIHVLPTAPLFLVEPVFDGANSSSSSSSSHNTFTRYEKTGNITLKFLSPSATLRERILCLFNNNTVAKIVTNLDSSDLTRLTLVLLAPGVSTVTCGAGPEFSAVTFTVVVEPLFRFYSVASSDTNSSSSSSNNKNNNPFSIMWVAVDDIAYGYKLPTRVFGIQPGMPASSYSWSPVRITSSGGWLAFEPNSTLAFGPAASSSVSFIVAPVNVAAIQLRLRQQGAFSVRVEFVTDTPIDAATSGLDPDSLAAAAFDVHIRPAPQLHISIASMPINAATGDISGTNYNGKALVLVTTFAGEENAVVFNVSIGMFPPESGAMTFRISSSNAGVSSSSSLISFQPGAGSMTWVSYKVWWPEERNNSNNNNEGIYSVPTTPISFTVHTSNSIPEFALLFQQRGFPAIVHFLPLGHINFNVWISVAYNGLDLPNGVFPFSQQQQQQLVVIFGTYIQLGITAVDKNLMWPLLRQQQVRVYFDMSFRAVITSSLLHPLPDRTLQLCGDSPSEIRTFWRSQFFNDNPVIPISAYVDSVASGTEYNPSKIFNKSCRVNFDVVLLPKLNLSIRVVSSSPSPSTLNVSNGFIIAPPQRCDLAVAVSVECTTPTGSAFHLDAIPATLLWRNIRGSHFTPAQTNYSLEPQIVHLPMRQLANAAETAHIALDTLLRRCFVIASPIGGLSKTVFIKSSFNISELPNASAGDDVFTTIVSPLSSSGAASSSSSSNSTTAPVELTTTATATAAPGSASTRPAVPSTSTKASSTVVTVTVQLKMSSYGKTVEPFSKERFAEQLATLLFTGGTTLSDSERDRMKAKNSILVGDADTGGKVSVVIVGPDAVAIAKQMKGLSAENLALLGAASVAAGGGTLAPPTTAAVGEIIAAPDLTVPILAASVGVLALLLCIFLVWRRSNNSTGRRVRRGDAQDQQQEQRGIGKQKASDDDDDDDDGDKQQKRNATAGANVVGSTATVDILNAAASSGTVQQQQKQKQKRSSLFSPTAAAAATGDAAAESQEMQEMLMPMGAGAGAKKQKKSPAAGAGTASHSNLEKLLLAEDADESDNNNSNNLPQRSSTAERLKKPSAAAACRADDDDDDDDAGNYPNGGREEDKARRKQCVLDFRRQAGVDEPTEQNEETSSRGPVATTAAAAATRSAGPSITMYELGEDENEARLVPVALPLLDLAGSSSNRNKPKMSLDDL